MSRFLVAVLGALLMVGVGIGCEKDKDDGSSRSGDSMKASSADACAHCPGVQKATADGKCPKCGMKVSSASSSGAAMTAGADVCTHCPGTQTATADGKCSACGAAVAAK